MRDSFLMRASSLDALDRFRNRFEKTNLTGRRPRVYLAPELEELCSLIRRVKSAAMPV